jgi:BMFP domain-containing protein YqiC
VRREVETAVRGQAERFLGDMDLVKREEFEAVRDMAARAREENEALRRRIAALESRIGIDGAEGSEPIKAGAANLSASGFATDASGAA